MVCAVAPWLAWVLAVAERFEGKHRAEDWATRVPGHPCSLWKRLGSDSCLRRRRGLLELCHRPPKFSEPRAGGAPIPLRRCCTLTPYLIHGSSCPAHASPSVSADCSGPTQEGCSPACRVASRRSRPGDLCMTPRTGCLSVLAHGVPICPAVRIDNSFSDQRPKVSLPSHSAPQTLL